MTRNEKSTRYHSAKHEKLIAKAMNGKVQCNSGATAFQKGDVKSDRFLFDGKTTMEEKKSFSIKRIELEKLDRERCEMGKDYSALVFNFGPNTDNYYVLSEKDMKNIVKELCENAA